MKSAQIDVNEYSYFADNQWRKATDNKFFEVHEPYSGDLFARVAAGSRADARAAVDAVAKAFPSWAESTPAERARLFLKAAEIVVEFVSFHAACDGTEIPVKTSP